MFSISPENSVFKEKITFTKESEFFLMDKVHRSEFSFLYKNSIAIIPELEYNKNSNIRGDRMLAYMTAGEAAKKWSISHRRVITLCQENRIPDVAMLGNMWIIPKDAVKPVDGRTIRYDKKNPAKPFVKWAGGKGQLLLQSENSILPEWEQPYANIVSLWSEQELCCSIFSIHMKWTSLYMRHECRAYERLQNSKRKCNSVNRIADEVRKRAP